MATPIRAYALPELGVRAAHSAPVIVATDGRAQSDGALVVGRMIAADPDALRLVTVLKTLPILSDAQLSVTLDLGAARRAGTPRDAATQMNRTWGDEYDFELREGDPATASLQECSSAARRRASCGARCAACSPFRTRP